MAKRYKTPIWERRSYRYPARITKGPVFWAYVDVEIKRAKEMGRGLPFGIMYLEPEVRGKWYEEMMGLAPGEGLRMAQLEDADPAALTSAVFIPKGMEEK